MIFVNQQSQVFSITAHTVKQICCIYNVEKLQHTTNNERKIQCSIRYGPFVKQLNGTHTNGHCKFSNRLIDGLKIGSIATHLNHSWFWIGVVLPAPNRSVLLVLFSILSLSLSFLIIILPLNSHLEAVFVNIVRMVNVTLDGLTNAQIIFCIFHEFRLISRIPPLTVS